MKHNRELQHAAGLVAWNLFEELEQLIKPGLNLLTIEELARKRIESNKMKPAFLGYKGYPAVTCLSVNSAVVHGIPYDYALKSGDVVAVDIGINNNGYLVDTARTYGVGEISSENQKLLTTTSAALEAAIPLCRAGTSVGVVGQSIQETVEAAGFSIIDELAGHGVGETLQEEPSVPNHGPADRGAKLTVGTVIAIEPITAVKPVTIAILEDGWTIIAQPDVVTAHFEHTVLITDNGPVVLTRP